MFFSLIAISSFYLIPDSGRRTGPVAVFTIVIYLAFYGIGAGPVPFTFSAEVFPLAFRGKQHPKIEIITSEESLTFFLSRGRHEFQCYGQFYWPYSSR